MDEQTIFNIIWRRMGFWIGLEELFAATRTSNNIYDATYGRNMTRTSRQPSCASRSKQSPPICKRKLLTTSIEEGIFSYRNFEIFCFSDARLQPKTSACVQCPPFVHRINSTVHPILSWSSNWISRRRWLEASDFPKPLQTTSPHQPKQKLTIYDVSMKTHIESVRPSNVKRKSVENGRLKRTKSRKTSPQRNVRNRPK